VIHDADGSAKQVFEFLDQPNVTRVVFHPRRDPPQLPSAPQVRSVRIPVDDGIAISGRLYHANAHGPTILFFHGNGELASDYDGISPLYISLGINLLVVDYRGYGDSDGRPTLSRMLSDAVAVHEETPAIFTEHGLQATPLFIMGRSLGSAAALEIAHHAGDRIAGLIIESGFAYTLRLLVTLGLRIPLSEADEERYGLSHLAKIAQIRVPTLIIHGNADWLIPVENAHALYENSGAPEKRLVIVPHAGHNDLMFLGQRPYFEALQTLIFGK
jgi:pimeloyl-ACP methyl ester carboxylesterase